MNLTPAMQRVVDRMAAGYRMFRGGSKYWIHAYTDESFSYVDEVAFRGVRGRLLIAVARKYCGILEYRLTPLGKSLAKGK